MERTPETKRVNVHALRPNCREEMRLEVLQDREAPMVAMPWRADGLRHLAKPTHRVTSV
jgi:hypothetical protein